MENKSKRIYDNPWLALSTYEERDKDRFKGREIDIEKMFGMLQQNEYVVVYAASGDGKSSLINAGLCPTMRENGYYPIKIVFSTDEYCGKGLATKNGALDFDEIILRKIKESLNNSHLEVIDKFDNISNDNLSHFLWWKLRTNKIQTNDGFFDYSPVLIFDQFEEILRANWKNDFFNWLETLSSDRCPDQIYGQLSDYEKIPKQKYFKAIFSLRYEYVGELDYWASQRKFIPQLMHSRYFLKPLSLDQAKEVIVNQQLSPELKDKFCSEATNILDNICKDSSIQSDSDEIQAVVLSLVCHILFEKWLYDITYPVDNVGINSVIYEYYGAEVDEIGISDEKRRIIENTLISSEGNRLRIHLSDNRLREIEFNQFIQKDAKKNLLSSHLVKISDDYVEFTHDRLVESILINRDDESVNDNASICSKKILFAFVFLLCTTIASISYFNKGFVNSFMPRNVDLSVYTSKQDTISSHQILITEASDSLFRQYDFKNATSIQLGKGVHSCNKDGIYCYGNTILFHRWQRYAESAKTIVFSKDFGEFDLRLNRGVKEAYIMFPPNITSAQIDNPNTKIYVPYGTADYCLCKNTFGGHHFIEMSWLETVLQRIKIDFSTSHSHLLGMYIPSPYIYLCFLCFFILYVIWKNRVYSNLSLSILILGHLCLNFLFLFLSLELFWIGVIGTEFHFLIPLIISYIIEHIRLKSTKSIPQNKGKANVCIVYNTIEGKQFAVRLRNELINYSYYKNYEISLDMTIVYDGYFRQEVFLKNVKNAKRVIAIITDESILCGIEDGYFDLLKKCKNLLPIIYSISSKTEEVSNMLSFSSTSSIYPILYLNKDYGIDQLDNIKDILQNSPLMNKGKKWLSFFVVCIPLFSVAFKHDTVIITCLLIYVAGLILFICIPNKKKTIGCIGWCVFYGISAIGFVPLFLILERFVDVGYKFFLFILLFLPISCKWFVNEVRLKLNKTCLEFFESNKRKL